MILYLFKIKSIFNDNNRLEIRAKNFSKSINVIKGKNNL